jgi:hypothetical protein
MLLISCFIISCQNSDDLIQGKTDIKKNASQSSDKNATQKQSEESQDGSSLKNILNESQEDSSWQSAYKDIIINSKDYLTDPYHLRGENGLNVWIYLGVHDFNNDNVPELILGDSISIGIFTYQNNAVVKVTELYEPEGWYCINGLYYKNNSLILVSNGSDGSGYVCLTNYDGNYITGFHDDYNPAMSILNEENTTYEEFEKIFHTKNLEDSSKISLIKMNINSGEISLEINNEKPDIPLNKLNLENVNW